MAGSIHGNQGFIPPEAPRINPPAFKPVPPPRAKTPEDIAEMIQEALTRARPPAPPPRESSTPARPAPLEAEQRVLGALKAAMPTARSEPVEVKTETKTPSGPAPASIPSELKTRHLQIPPPLPPSQRGSQVNRSSQASQKALTSSAALFKKPSYETGAIRKGAIGGHRKEKTPNYGLNIPLPGTEGLTKTTISSPAVKQAQASVLSTMITWARKLFS